MDDNSANRTKRLAFLFSSAIDMFLGGALLLIGFGLTPIAVSEYGFENWQVILAGGVIFLLGVIVGSYNLARLKE